jgi:hypothetical protein
MPRFETKWPSRAENRAALADLPGQSIDKVTTGATEDHRARHGFERETHLRRAGRQRYNGHFGFTSRHPLFAFNHSGRFGLPGFTKPQPRPRQSAPQTSELDPRPGAAEGEPVDCPQDLDSIRVHAVNVMREFERRRSRSGPWISAAAYPATAQPPRAPRWLQIPTDAR